MAMGGEVKEALFVQGMVEFLVPAEKLSGIRVLEDNAGAIALADNPNSSSNSKHIDVWHHFLRDLVDKKKIEVEHVGSEEQHADTLAKALPRATFDVHRDFFVRYKVV